MGEMHGRGVVQRRLYPVFAQVIEVGWKLDVDWLVGTGGDFVDPQICTKLINDAAVGQRGGLYIPAFVMRVLFDIAAILIHGPQVHSAVAITHKIDTVVPPPSAFAGSGVIGSEGNRFRAGREFPNILRGAALIALGLAALKIEAREEERAPLRIVGALRSLAQRNYLDAIGAVDGSQLSIRQLGVTARHVEDFSVVRPSNHSCVAAFEGASRGQAAGRGKCVDFGGAFVVGGKGDGFAVGRKRGISFFAGVRSETPRDASVDGGLPQVAFGSEGDHISMDG